MTAGTVVSSAEPAIAAGSRLAGYRLRRVVDERPGVYTAVEAVAADRGRFTLKILARELSSDPETSHEFIDRAQLRASIRHPALLPLECGADGPWLYIAIPRPRALTLADWLRDGLLTPDEAMAVLTPIASALDLAGERGLLHHELEPASIFVVEGRRVRALLGDFGVPVPDSRARVLGRLVDAAEYASPEVIRGDPLELRSSVYSLACILLACLTGAPPFTTENPLTTLEAHLTQAPPQVTERNPALPASLDDVMARGLAKDPSDRFESPSQLVAAAQHALDTGHIRPLPPRAHRVPSRAVAVVAVATLGGLAVGAATTGSGGSGSGHNAARAGAAVESPSLRKALSSLGARRAAGLNQLKSARTAETQAAAAARLARDYQQAQRAATRAPAPVVQAALGDVGRAYARLAAAARTGNAAAYQAARQTVTQTETALARTIGHLP